MAVPSQPDPCREQDLGLFEITKRDGFARIGRFNTLHGSFTTPLLLPVVNPNIRTIDPREMWEVFGVEALITNSYVIWKNDELRSRALKDGIHATLDFPGAIVTDSGTFQSYVYGDVEVEPREIVAFQRDIGVDVGTMLDVFGRPDMDFEALEAAVEETSRRSPISLEEAGSKLLLNGPIQGGLHDDLRVRSANLMSSATGKERGFAIHPVGGIVPLMEKQRYLDLFRILLATKSALPPDRPVHLFGCGHPMLFPMAIALGADFFDSAAYAIFARDDRILTPEGTVKLDSIKEWPFTSKSLFGTTPDQVRAMGAEDRCRLLARHNLEITQAELSRCREAVRRGTIWQLAEQRSHCSPHLRDAFVWLQHQMLEPDEGPIGESVLSLISSTNPIREGGESLSEDITTRPHILHLNALLATRWRPPGSWWDSSTDGPRRVIIIEGAKPPWRNSALTTAVRALADEPKSVVMITTPLGLIPFTLEDLSPWCHLTGPDEIWSEIISEEEIKEILSDFGLSDLPILRVQLEESDEIEHDKLMQIKSWIERCSVVDKLSVICDIHPMNSCGLTSQMSVRRSRTDRVVNVISEDKHILSPRLTDGGLSLSIEGARAINEFHKSPVPVFGSKVEGHIFTGMPRIHLRADAIPFVGKGRNVVHGYALGADPHLTPGLPCLIVDSEGSLVAHGTSLSTATEMEFMERGIAVKIRGGALKGND